MIRSHLVTQNFPHCRRAESISFWSAPGCYKRRVLIMGGYELPGVLRIFGMALHVMMVRISLRS